MGVKVLNDLKKEAKKVKWGSDTKEYYLLVSSNGFDKELIELAAVENITLIDGDILEKIVFE
ncbi:MAG TPA: hypothetical protein HA306_08975 [Methanosarcina sp.]|nr:hypothetical protein [Methanosarcina sp.]